MGTSELILSIDQGTTSSRAVVFDRQSKIVALAQKEFKQFYPDDGWVEHDPEEIWQTTLDTCKQAMAVAAGAGGIAGIGITNQRETTIVWDRQTGKPVHNAIVWQDRRTASTCEQIKRSGVESLVTSKTGLLLDPYFSATKIGWILDNVSGARARADAGQLAFGTVDSFLIWRLTNGKCHFTDATNASRTMLFNIETGKWDAELLDIFNIPDSVLPEVKSCAADFGTTDKAVLGAGLNIAGVAGDQQAALVGQTCFNPGMLKSTYGTGCFMMMNAGKQPIYSSNKLLTTVGYQLNNQITYALEGSIFNAGTAIQWLRDGIGIIQDTDEIQQHLTESVSNHGVYMVPAFTGLGAPHWEPDARGIVCGITRDTSASDLVRAAIESVCYQTHDLIDAMLEDSGLNLSEIRVDGGMTANNWLLQFLADITGARICKPVITETTALGASYLAGLQLGIFESTEEIASTWNQEISFDPDMDSKSRAEFLHEWDKAIERCLV
jgi:glycerol kinase